MKTTTELRHSEHLQPMLRTRPCGLKSCTRRMRRFCGRIVGCFSLLLAFVLDCGDIRPALGNPPDKSIIAVRNPQVLPPQIPAERIPLGIAGDYKPSLALLPGGELLLVMFHGVNVGGGKIREDMIHYRSVDGGKTWGERQVLPLLGREPYFSRSATGRCSLRRTSCRRMSVIAMATSTRIFTARRMAARPGVRCGSARKTCQGPPRRPGLTPAATCLNCTMAP